MHPVADREKAKDGQLLGGVTGEVSVKVRKAHFHSPTDDQHCLYFLVLRGVGLRLRPRNTHEPHSPAFDGSSSGNRMQLDDHLGRANIPGWHETKSFSAKYHHTVASWKA